jgi:hypothetical protein
MNTIPGDWLDAVSNPQAIRQLYKSAPRLAEVHELSLHRDGPKLELRVEAGEFADFPARRWSPEFNRVQVVLRFIAVERLRLSDWTTENRLVSYLMTRTDTSIDFSFEGFGWSLAGACRWVDVVSVTAYQVA